MSHTSAWWRSLPSNEAHNGQFACVICTDPSGCFFLGLASDLSNHNNALCLWILHKSFEAIDKVCSIERITTDANNGRLTQTMRGSLVDSFVGKGTRPRDDSDLALAVDVAWHNTNLALAGLNDAGAVWPN